MLYVHYLLCAHDARLLLRVCGCRFIGGVDVGGSIFINASKHDAGASSRQPLTYDHIFHIERRWLCWRYAGNLITCAHRSVVHLCA